MFQAFRSTRSTMLLFVMMLLGQVGWGQISITNGSAVVENFNGIGSTATASLPSNWKFSAAGQGSSSLSYYSNAANLTATTAAASSGSPTAGGRYNWGNGTTTTDRAIGFMTSGSYSSPNSIMAWYRNISGVQINDISVSFDFERYRINSNTCSVAFYTSTDGTTWTSRSGGDISTTEFAVGASSYTFTGGTTSSKTVSLTGVNIANNSHFYLMWVVTNTNSSSSQGIGLDNVSLTATLATIPTITGAATATAFTTTYGTASAAQSFSVSGSNLTANLVATAPTGFEVSSDGNTYGATATFTQTSGSVNGTLRIRLASTAAVSGSYNSQNIELSSDGAASLNIATSASGNAVSAKELTITGLSAADKDYDGTTTVSVTGTPEYSGLVNSELFSVTGAVTWAFPDANVGANKTLTRTGSYDAPSTNYTVTQPSLTASINAVVPGAPSISSVNAGDAQLTVTFTPPASNGGATITNYEYSTNDGSSWVTPSPANTSSPFIISGLTNGTTYDIKIRAVNSVGSGSASSAVQGTPTAPTTPTIFAAGTLSVVSTTYGTASASPTSFTVSGSALTNDITVAAPTGFEVSSGSVYSSTIILNQIGGSVASTTIYVRLAATTNVGTYSGSIELSSTGATSQNVATVSSTVSAKTLTITGLLGNNKPYDGTTVATATGTALLDGVVSGDEANLTLNGIPTYTFFSANAGLNISIITTGYLLGGSAAGNYSLVQPTLSADISKVTLTITADDQSIPFGTPVATVTGSGSYSPSGFVNGENASVLGGIVTYTTTYTSSTPVGANVATITPVTSSLTATNYSFSAVNGNISVNVAVPSLISPSSSSISTSTAILGANISSDGGAALTERGTVWGTSAGPDGNSLAEGGTSVGSYSHQRIDFTPNTVYYYRGYAVNSAGTGYSSDGTFTTLHNAPTSLAASSISKSGFTANWSAPTGGGSATFTYTLQYSTTSDFSSGNNSVTGISSSTLSQAVTGLTAGTQYWYRVMVVNVGGNSAWSSPQTLTTTFESPGVLLSEENFTFSGQLTSNGYVVANSGGTTPNPLTAASNSALSYSNYASSGFGGGLPINTSGEDLLRLFSSQASSATVYCSFLMNVSGTQANGDYFFAISPTLSSTTAFKARTFIKTSGAGFVVGISTSTNTAVWGSTVFSLNTTYNVVVKYQFTSGTSAVASIYVNPSLTAEPSSPEVSQTESTPANAPADISNFVIRQGSASNAPALTIDGIRIATGWGAVTGNPQYSDATKIETGNYNNVTLYSGATTSLLGDPTINGTLTFSGGNLSIGSKTLTLAGTVSGMSTSSYITGSAASNLTINGTGSLGTLFFDATTPGTTNSLQNLTINRTSSGSVTLGNALNIYDQLNVTAGTLSSGGNLTLKSTDAKTARVGVLPGANTITGDVTVERYFRSDKRAWRMVTAPVSVGSANSSIYNNWQTSITASPNTDATTGTTGVMVWGPGGGNGLFAGPSTSTYSMRTWNYATQLLESVTNTQSTDLFTSDGINPKSFFLFVTGPYNTPSITSPYADVRVSAKGSLRQGNQNFIIPSAEVVANNYYLVGNPYASPVNHGTATIGSPDYSLVMTNTTNQIWMWDPNLSGTNGIGGYVSFDRLNNDYSVSGDNTGLSYTDGVNYTRLQSGQSFFVRAASSIPSGEGLTVAFTENSKGSDNAEGVFRQLNRDLPIKLRSTLQRSFNGAYATTDGAIAYFYQDGAKEVNDVDGVKMMNSANNIMFRRNGVNLTFEHRPLIQNNDTLFLGLRSTSAGSYRLILKGSEFDRHPGIDAILQDLYLEREENLRLDTTVVYEFSVDANAASTGDRFRIVFRNKTTPPPQEVELGSHFSSYPNPIRAGESLYLKFRNRETGKYTVAIYNMLGIQVQQQIVMHGGGSSVHNIALNAGLPNGTYLIQILDGASKKIDVRKINVQ